MWGAAGSCEEKGGALARSTYGRTCVVHDISRHSIVDLEDVLSISAAFYQHSDGFSTCAYCFRLRHNSAPEQD